MRRSPIRLSALPARVAYVSRANESDRRAGARAVGRAALNFDTFPSVRDAPRRLRVLTRPDFFISHATPDREWAQWIAWQLEAGGLTTYLPIRDLRPGSDRGELEEAMLTSERAIAVLSPDYLRSDTCEREWRAIADRVGEEHEPTLVPVRVRECEPTGRLGQLAYLDLVGLDEQGAAEQLKYGVGNGQRPSDPPAFPSSVVHGQAEEPHFPRELSTLEHPVELVITLGDILSIGADVVAFKYASDAEGVTVAATELLRDAGIEAEDLQPGEGSHTLVPTRGALGAARALFVGVAPMREFSYRHVKTLGARMLERLAVESPRTAHLATTIHGPGVSLDEVESVLSLVAGFLDALQRHQVPSGLERVTIVETRSERLEQMAAGLERHLSEVPDATLVSAGDDRWVFRVGVPGGAAKSPTAPAEAHIGLLDRTPEKDPRVFVAFPFKLGDHFRFGIQGPAREAGFLCEHFGEEAFMGEILDRVKTQIEHAAVVIGVLTDANPNVYLEVGYAWGKQKPTILVAKEDEELKFDVQGHRCLLYTSIEELERKMIDELTQLRGQGVI